MVMMFFLPSARLFGFEVFDIVDLPIFACLLISSFACPLTISLSSAVFFHFHVPFTTVAVAGAVFSYLAVCRSSVDVPWSSCSACLWSTTPFLTSSLCFLST